MRFPGTGSRTTDAILQQSSMTDERAANKQRAKEARMQALIQIGGIGANLAGDVVRIIPQIQAIRQRDEEGEQERAFERMMAGEDFERAKTLEGIQSGNRMGELRFTQGALDTRAREDRQSAEADTTQKLMFDQSKLFETLRAQKAMADEDRLYQTDKDALDRDFGYYQEELRNASMPDRYSSPLEKQSAELMAPFLMDRATDITQDLPLGEQLQMTQDIMSQNPRGVSALRDAEERRQFGEAARAIGKEGSDVFMAEKGEPGFYGGLGRTELLNMAAALLMRDEKNSGPRILKMLQAAGGEIPKPGFGERLFGDDPGLSSYAGALAGIPAQRSPDYAELEALIQALQAEEKFKQGQGPMGPPVRSLSPGARSRLMQKLNFGK